MLGAKIREDTLSQSLAKFQKEYAASDSTDREERYPKKVAQLRDQDIDELAQC